MLWSQHVYRTRFFIISTLSNLPDLPFVTKWLLQNPNDFAVLFERFYGKAKANEFRKLFTEHLTIAAELVNSAKNNQKDKVLSARKKWYENAEAIAEFLARINPFWSVKKWTQMLNTHLELTEKEVLLRLAGKYQEDINNFNTIENSAMLMADYMSDGIRMQFRGSRR
ncbi:MAG: acetylglutamate kinase [Acutalibacteraceae bacterium]